MKSYYLWILFLLLAFSCRTMVPVQVRKPAELNVGSARTIAVLDFDFKGSWDFSAGEKDSKKLKDLITKVLTQKDKKMPDPEKAYPGNSVSEQFIAKLVQNGYYTVIERSRIEEIMQEQSLSLSGLVDEAQAVKVGSLIGAQAMITGSGSYSVKDEGEWEKYKEKVKKDGKKVEVEKERYKISRKASAQITFRIIDVTNGSVIASKTNKAANYSDSWRGIDMKYQSTGDNEEEAAKGLPDWKPIIDKLVNDILDNTINQIAPHTITEKREIESGDSKKMEAALEYAKRDMWDEAGTIWREVLQMKPEKEDKIAATYNLGLYHEIFGQLDQAEEFYEKAFKLSGDSKYLDSKARIKKRRQELEKLRQQEADDTTEIEN